MPAYVVAFVNPTDIEAMQEYGSKVMAVTESFGGRYLWVGPGVEVLEGDWKPQAIAIIEFPSHEDAQRWYASEEYTPLIALRQKAGETGMVITPDADS
jgi:uncharacterized protein (DUF1330 family)